MPPEKPRPPPDSPTEVPGSVRGIWANTVGPLRIASLRTMSVGLSAVASAAQR